MVYKVEGATPIRLAFWGSVGPRDLKPAAIRAGACVAARQPGWARRVCGRPAGGPDGVRGRLVSERPTESGRGC
jgi:hypothetical protein